MEVMEFGMVIFVSPVQFQKVFGPIEVTEFGMVTSINSVQL